MDELPGPALGSPLPSAARRRYDFHPLRQIFTARRCDCGGRFYSGFTLLNGRFCILVAGLQRFSRRRVQWTVW